MLIRMAVSGDKQLITRPKRGMRKKERVGDPAPVGPEYFFVDIRFDASYRVNFLTFFLASPRIFPP